MKNKQKIKEALINTLIKDASMSIELYDFQFDTKCINQFKKTMIRDNDDCFFSITEERNYIAMIFIDKNGNIYANELAKNKLKEVWGLNYENNILMLIDNFCIDLFNECLSMNGMKIQ